jgi:hypothetical protein
LPLQLRLALAPLQAPQRLNALAQLLFAALELGLPLQQARLADLAG